MKSRILKASHWFDRPIMRSEKFWLLNYENAFTERGVSSSITRENLKYLGETKTWVYLAACILKHPPITYLILPSFCRMFGKDDEMSFRILIVFYLKLLRSQSINCTFKATEYEKCHIKLNLSKLLKTMMIFNKIS